MSALSPAGARSPGVAQRQPTTDSARWLVPCCYLLAAVVLTWRMWADPAGRAQTGDSHDIDLFAWFMRYSATAISHGRLPSLVTTALNAPEGINLMWNTSVLLPGLVLAPVTLLAGPQASLTVLLTLGFAGSAASLYWVLRRWGTSTFAAALGGAVYGFSPALLASAAGHYHLEFAVLPPLIIDLLMRIATGRGHVRTGVWLGLLTAAQIFISEELLAQTAVAAVILIAVVAASRAREVRGVLRGAAGREAVRRAAAALATGAGITLLICGYPLWVQFHGPLTQHGSPWPTAFFVSHPGVFVTPPGGLLLHTSASAATAAAYPERPPEYLAYLGYPLLVLLLVAAVRYWRDERVRVTAVTLALLELFSFGGAGTAIGGVTIPAAFLPWHWLEALPVLADTLPDRFAILSDGAAGALLAFSLDLARRRGLDPPGEPAGRRGPRGRTWRWRVVPAMLAIVAVTPLTPLPLETSPVPPVPAGWRIAFARLRLAPGARVLLIPAGPLAMRWQATTGEPVSLIGGRCIAPGPNGAATNCQTPHSAVALYLGQAAAGGEHGPVPSQAALRRDLAYWRPAAIVAVMGRRPRARRQLTRFLGSPTVRAHSVIAWRLPLPGQTGLAEVAGNPGGASVHPDGTGRHI